MIWLALAVATGLACVHLLAGQLRFIRMIPRSGWLSAAGGGSIGYVFTHLFPELHRSQEHIAASNIPHWLLAIEHHVYLIALLGFATFYGLERLVQIHSGPHSQRNSPTTIQDQKQRLPSTPGSTTAATVFWVHIGVFAGYNALIGYLLLHRLDDEGVDWLVGFGTAMALHFIVNDFGLYDRHQNLYDRYGRWLLAAASILGWAAGMLGNLHEAVVAGLYGFLGGAVILNVIKEELPRERESRFWPFAVGAAAYVAIILLARQA